jgi:hypothetical protein
MKMHLTLLAPLLLAACGSTPTPNYDLRFGDAVREARQRQVLNPAAGLNPAPVTGLDGKVAEEAMTLYRNSFKAPPPVVNVINIGGQTGGGNR